MKLLLAFATLSLMSAPVLAAPCKDPKTGRFMKCPTAAAKATKCRDTKGHFAKCGTAGAKPA